MGNLEKYRGIHKVTEEAGELLQVIGKLCNKPYSESLRAKLSEELTDLEAAIAYLRSEEGLPLDRDRFMEKGAKHFEKGLRGIPL